MIAGDDEVILEYIYRETDGEFWLDLNVNRQPYAQVGPFDTPQERQRAHDDLLATLRSTGAADLPLRVQ